MRRRPEDNLLLSLLGILPGAPTLEPVPQVLRHFPLRAVLAFSCAWCCWGGGGGDTRWPALLSCLYERKLAVSQQTQELSVARGRPLPPREGEGNVGKCPLLSQLPQLGTGQPFPASWSHSS